MFFNIFFENNFKFFLPEFFLISATLILILYATIFSVSKSHKNPLLHLTVAKISIIILFFSLSIIYVLPFELDNITFFNGTFIFDRFSQSGKNLILIAGIFFFIINYSYFKIIKINFFEYQILILFAILGLKFLCSAFDLLSFYLALELQSLSLYVLATFNKNSAYSTEAGLKYFVLGAFSSGFLLFGISFIYGFTGTTNFEDLKLLFSTKLFNNAGIQLGLFLIISSFLFKIGAAPFHIWIPDVYDGSAFSSTSFFAILPKIGIFFVFTRFFLFALDAQPEIWQHFFCIVSVLSIFIGSFLALKQRKIKRLFAYSSISHVGYIIFAISALDLSGVQASIIYLVVYTLTNFGVWSILHSLNNRNNLLKVRGFSEISFLSKLNPFLGLSFTFFLFSLAGIPPLCGFYAKFSIFLTSINNGFYLYSFLILVFSVISSFYYIRLVKIIYFDKPFKKAKIIPLKKEHALTISFFTYLLFFLFVNPNYLWLFTYESVMFLFF